MPVASSVGSLRFLPLDQSVTTIPAICCSLQLGLFLLSQLPLASSLQYQCFHPHSLSHPTTCVHILFAEHFLGSFQTLTFFLKRSLPKSRIYYCCAPKSGLVRPLRIHHQHHLLAPVGRVALSPICPRHDPTIVSCRVHRKLYRFLLYSLLRCHEALLRHRHSFSVVPRVTMVADNHTIYLS